MRQQVEKELSMPICLKIVMNDWIRYIFRGKLSFKYVKMDFFPLIITNNLLKKLDNL